MYPILQDTVGGTAGVASEVQMRSVRIVFEKYVKGIHLMVSTNSVACFIHIHDL
jgi:hypothetical protein